MGFIEKERGRHIHRPDRQVRGVGGGVKNLFGTILRKSESEREMCSCWVNEREGGASGAQLAAAAIHSSGYNYLFFVWYPVLLWMKYDLG